MPTKRKNKGKEKTRDSVVFPRILGQRVRGEKTYFKVEWKGQLLHTWELEENLNPQSVAEFKKRNAEKVVVGGEQNLEPEAIIGMYEVKDERMFKMKWKGTNRTDFIPLNEAKLKCPQEVIKYYETKIVWCE
ncbi:Chromobox protein like 1 [Pseudolycoriella hygida]|uniref:Chromobox protein like 1 n=1 Tax=Pseudolycoriella hygida TaxID=35572 RepID=A0A9Q0MLB7_9DIPT|nr:Chromobox protein like 1 [Pseudolycoriella hygida]